VSAKQSGDAQILICCPDGLPIIEVGKPGAVALGSRIEMSRSKGSRPPATTTASVHQKHSWIETS
jgi:hypothetical protein